MPRLSDTFLSHERAKTVKTVLTFKGVKFTIASFYNEAFRDALGELSPEATKEERFAVWAEYVLLDWEGLEDDKGSELKPTKENRAMLMCDYEEVGNIVIAYSQNTDNFLKDEVKDELGN